MAVALSFRDLRVYQAARSAAKQFFEISKRSPPEERYSLADQIRKASRSVSANIAEGWGKRWYPASFAAKLADAEGESNETRSWLDSALDCRYITAEEFRDLDSQYDRILAQLFRMIDDAESWCADQSRPAKPSNRHSD